MTSLNRFILTALIVSLSATAADAQTSSCRAVDDHSNVMLGALRTLVTTTDPIRMQIRDTLGLSPTAPANVVVELDKRICDKIVAGMNSQLRTVGLARRLYVIKVGTDYAASDPDHLSGEWMPVVTFDKTGKFKGVILAL